MKIRDLIDTVHFSYNWDVIEKIPEFAKLKECEQNPKWHSEGNAAIHTRMVCNAAIKTIPSLDTEWHKEVFLAAALFHDIGKGVTTNIGRDGNWHSYNHETEGEKITRWLFWDEDIAKREAVCSLVRWHMEPLNVLKSKDRLDRINFLAHIVPSWQLLIYLKMCDIVSSIRGDGGNNDTDLECMAELLRTTMAMSSYRSAGIPLRGKTAWDKLQKNGKPRIAVRMLIGLSGSGKSTYAKRFSDSTYANNFENCVVISRDSIREELGFCNEGDKVVLDASQEKKVSDVFNLRLVQAAKEGKDIVIDNLNLKRKYRDAYKNLLKDFNVDWYYYYIYADNISINLERRDGVMTEEILKNMIMNFDWPTPDEYDYFEMYNSSKNDNVNESEN